MFCAPMVICRIAQNVNNIGWEHRPAVEDANDNGMSGFNIPNRARNRALNKLLLFRFIARVMWILGRFLNLDPFSATGCNAGIPDGSFLVSAFASSTVAFNAMGNGL